MSEKTLLDNLANKSDIDMIKASARRSLAWAAEHGLVDKETGEYLQNSDGEVVTLEQLSRSWYSAHGARNNLRLVSRRVQRISAYRSPERPKFITLTFRDIVQSWVAERAIQKFTDALRTYSKRAGRSVAYFWVAEVQKRGALHYHILVLGAPYIPKSRLQSWWRYGFIDVRVIDDIGRAVKYVAKYMWKWRNYDFENLPDWWFLFSLFNRRRFGFSRYFALPLLERVPSWLRDTLETLRAAYGDIVRGGRALGGGWSIEFQSLTVHIDSVFSVAPI